MSAAKRRVVFLGTPAVAARSLELLLGASAERGGGGFEVAAVVAQPPARSGRKMKLTASPVQTLAEARGIELLTPASAKEEAFLARLDELQPDLCITAAYGCFLPQRFLDLPKFGTLNIHPSLLPLYRGAAPVQRCLEAGDPLTGVTVAFTVLAMDAGPVLRQVERPLGGDEMADELLLELFEAGSEQLLDALPSVWDGSCEAALAPQDGERATKAAKVDALNRLVKELMVELPSTIGPCRARKASDPADVPPRAPTPGRHLRPLSRQRMLDDEHGAWWEEHLLLAGELREHRNVGAAMVRRVRLYGRP